MATTGRTSKTRPAARESWLWKSQKSGEPLRFGYDFYVRPRLTMLLAAACLTFGSIGGAAADQVRVALVIGNGDYKGAKLSKTASDARMIGRTLDDLGFGVVTLRDLDLKGLSQAIQEFGNLLQAAGPETVGLFFYAGHGVQVGGRNYLVPIGAKDGSADAVAVSVASVLAAVEGAGNGMNFVFLDASYGYRYGKALGSDKAGLAPMKAPDGMLVGFSAAPDKKAIKTVGDHSNYSVGLVKLMETKGTSMTQFIALVQRYVMGSSATKQIPWSASSLKGEFFFTPSE